KDFDESKLARVGLTANQTTQMYRLLAIAKYEDRFVIPSSHRESQMNVYRSQGEMGYDMGTSGAGDSQQQYSYSVMGENGQCDDCCPGSPAQQYITGLQIVPENCYGGLSRD